MKDEKAYKQLVENFGSILNLNTVKESGVISVEDIRKLIPELKESEDERIRKFLTKCVKENMFVKSFMADGFDKDEVLAWLEKQVEQKSIKVPKFKAGDFIQFNGMGHTRYTVKEVCGLSHYINTCDKRMDMSYTDANFELVEQKPADKVEPKFKAGEWYMCIKDFFGRGVRFDKGVSYYCAKDGCLQNEYGCHIAIVNDLYDNFKLWTIQDAKNGDVLKFGDHERLVVGIVSHINKGTGKVDVYCLLEANNFKVGNYYALDTINPHPATKEQRELLFSKMKEAGYEWDADKLELRKIEQKPAEKTTWYDNMDEKELEKTRQKMEQEALAAEKERITSEYMEQMQKDFGYKDYTFWNGLKAGFDLGAGWNDRRFTEKVTILSDKIESLEAARVALKEVHNEDMKQLRQLTIDKACAWIEKEAFRYIVTRPIHGVEATVLDVSITADFRKAMEDSQ